jgi:hypothetical protein
VILPFGLQREVDAHFKAYISKKPTSRGLFPPNSLSRSNGGRSMDTDERIYERPELSVQNSVAMERILSRKSLQLRNQQEKWQVNLPWSVSQIYLLQQLPFLSVKLFCIITYHDFLYIQVKQWCTSVYYDILVPCALVLFFNVLGFCDEALVIFQVNFGGGSSTFWERWHYVSGSTWTF